MEGIQKEAVALVTEAHADLDAVRGCAETPCVAGPMTPTENLDRYVNLERY